MTIYKAAHQHDKRQQRAEALRPIIYGAALGAYFFGLGLLWALGVV